MNAAMSARARRGASLLALCVGLGMAGPAHASLPAEAAACEELAPLAAQATAVPMGQSGPAAVLHVSAGAKRFLAVVHPADEDEKTSGGQGCEVFALSPSRARSAGHFAPGLAQVTALTPRPCSGESCPLLLAFLDGAGRPRQALRTAEHCDQGAVARPIKLFPDAQGLEVTCRRSAGAGYLERRLVVAVVDGAPRVLFDMNTGSYQAPTAAECRAGSCVHHPAGWLRVVRAGAQPTLLVLEPRDEDMHDGKGTSPAYEWTYDPAGHRFTRAATGTPTAFDAQRGCRGK